MDEEIDLTNGDFMGLAEFFFGPECTKCKGIRTYNVFRNQPICTKCQAKIQAKERLEAAKLKEGDRLCTSCGHMMDKYEIQNNLFIDKCPRCKGVFLDGGELNKIKEIYYAKGEDSNEGSGFLTGIVVGSLLD